MGPSLAAKHMCFNTNMKLKILWGEREREREREREEGGGGGERERERDRGREREGRRGRERERERGREREREHTISKVPKADAQFRSVCPTSSMKFTSKPASEQMDTHRQQRNEIIRLTSQRMY